MRLLIGLLFAAIAHAQIGAVTSGVSSAPAAGGGSMVYPGSGWAVSTGSAWGTSITPGTGVATFVTTPSSANLRAAITDESGTGAALFAGGNIGAATGTSLALTGALTAGSISTGASPPAEPTGGTAGAAVIGIGTAPTANCEVAGVICYYGHSTGNAWKASYNGDTASRIARYSDALSAFAIGPGTTRGDIYYLNATPALARLAIGAAGTVLHGGTDPSYSAVSLTADVSGTLPVGNLPAGVKTSGFGAAFDGGGSAIATNATTYMVTPIACTIVASNILVDTGTLTFKVWRAATGTAIPTSGGSINTSGIAISTGTALRTTTTSDYTDTTLDANDILAITITAISGATKANIFVECNP